MGNIVYRSRPNEKYSHTIKEMVDIANSTGKTVTSEIDNIPVSVNKGDDPVEVAIQWGIRFASEARKRR